MKSQKVKISKRLKFIANLAIAESTLVDLGVDSGNLDIFLAQNSSNIKTIFAIEEKQKPFTNLCKNIEYFNVGKIIKPILDNTIPNEDFNCLIIAGLGCYTIWDVINKFGLKNLNNKHLILGPQGSQLELFILRKRLSEYFDIKVNLIKDMEKIYEIWDLNKIKNNPTNVTLMFDFETEDQVLKKEYIRLKKEEIEEFIKYFKNKTVKENSFQEFQNVKLFKELLNYENF